MHPIHCSRTIPSISISINLPSIPRSTKSPIAFRFPDYNCKQIPYFPHSHATPDVFPVARFQTCAKEQMRTALPDVSGQPIYPISNGQEKMGPIGCPETSLNNYHYSLRNCPEERSFRLLRGESLKSRIVFFVGCLSPS